MLVELAEVRRRSVVNEYATSRDSRTPLFVPMTDEFGFQESKQSI